MFTDRVAQTLINYGLDVVETSHAHTLWNTLFRVRTSDRGDFALRLCNPVMQGQSLIEQELAFLEFVAEGEEVRVPKPVRNRDGALVTVVSSSGGPQLACLFEWIEGRDLRGHVTLARAREMGRMAARLHRLAGAYAFPREDDGIRLGYAYDETLVLLHHEWIAEHEGDMCAERAAQLRAVVDRTAAQIGAMPKTPATYGFIHADLHPGNFIADGNGNDLALLDFDQLGRGHFAFDLANLRAELLGEPGGEALWAMAKMGYGDIAPLPFADEVALQPFIAAVELAFLDWYYNSPNPDVRLQGERFALAWNTLTQSS